MLWTLWSRLAKILALQILYLHYYLLALLYNSIYGEARGIDNFNYNIMIL